MGDCGSEGSGPQSTTGNPKSTIKQVVSAERTMIVYSLLEGIREKWDLFWVPYIF